MKAVIMPKMGFTMTESTIVQWLKHEGDAVSQGEPIAEVTTDKVNMEVEAPESGTLAGLKFKEGDTVPVTEIIAYVLKAGEQVPAEDGGRRTEDRPLAPLSPQHLSTSTSTSTFTSSPSSSGPLTQSAMMPKSATPIALRMAQELGIDLATVNGSGQGGKITREDVEAAAKRATQNEAVRNKSAESASASAKHEHTEPAPTAPANAESGVMGKVRATPAARRTAHEAGVDLASVRGSGPNARVQASDVDQAQAQTSNVKRQSSAPQAQPQPPMVNAPPAQTQVPSVVGRPSAIPYAGMRKTIGTRLTQSYQELPHITFDADADVTLAEQLRARVNAKLKAGHNKVSLTAIVVKACAWALGRHPIINSRLDLAAGQIYLLNEINIGVAVALDNGLVVPVIKQANQKGIQQIANELADLAARAKTNKLKGDELQGGTFSISNLGMYGVTRFTAIINPPETAILAVGASRRQFVPDANDQPVLRSLMGLRLSADHRVIDGAIAAQFLAEVTAAIEDPALMAM